MAPVDFGERMRRGVWDAYQAIVEGCCLEVHILLVPLWWRMKGSSSVQMVAWPEEESSSIRYSHCLPSLRTTGSRRVRLD